jgi:hypothetical protein
LVSGARFPGRSDLAQKNVLRSAFSPACMDARLAPPCRSESLFCLEIVRVPSQLLKIVLPNLSIVLYIVSFWGPAKAP